MATRPRRILLIEDNCVAARSLQMFLSKVGHIVEMALNGPDGVNMARRFQPEIVICDIGLPGLDGYAVAQALRLEPVDLVELERLLAGLTLSGRPAA